MTFIAAAAGFFLGWLARVVTEKVRAGEKRLDRQVDDLLPGHPRDEGDDA